MEKKVVDQLLESVQNNPLTTPNNKDMLEKFLTIEHPGNVLFTKWTNPPVMKHGEGNKIWDVDGKEYIDCISGMSCINLGHSEKRVADAMYDEYMDGLDNWFDFPSPQRLKLAQRLIDVTPGDFRKRVRFALSGSDAVENAIRLARYHTKKTQIISFYGGYHGQNTATMGLTGAGAMHRWYNPVPPQDNCIERFPYPYAYQWPYNKGQNCLDDLFAMMEALLNSSQTSLGNPASGVNNIAAMIVEPCQSSAGYIVPPKGFLKRLREMADKYNFILIFDEIQTGLGRTGKMWACEHEDVAPDMLLVGKALGAGIPMSAVVGRAEYFEDTAPGFICSTYAGYSIGCSVGNAVLDIIEEDNLIEKCAKSGEYLKEQLVKFQAKHPALGDYSALGVYLGMEFVMDRETREPARMLTAELVDNLRESGLLVQLNGYYGNRVSFIPPITITPKQWDEIFDILDPELTKIEKKYNLI